MENLNINNVEWVETSFNNFGLIVDDATIHVHGTNITLLIRKQSLFSTNQRITQAEADKLIKKHKLIKKQEADMEQYTYRTASSTVHIENFFKSDSVSIT